jgi:hypothetical protein
MTNILFDGSLNELSSGPVARATGIIFFVPF